MYGPLSKSQDGERPAPSYQAGSHPRLSACCGVQWGSAQPGYGLGLGWGSWGKEAVDFPGLAVGLRQSAHTSWAPVALALGRLVFICIFLEGNGDTWHSHRANREVEVRTPTFNCPGGWFLILLRSHSESFMRCCKDRQAQHCRLLCLWPLLVLM